MHVINYGSVEELEDIIVKAKKSLEIYAKKFKFESEILVETGEPAKEILSKAVERNATAIVLGKTGRSFIRELLMGSVATTVLKESKISTLVVPFK
ncbi:universal stress protein [Archaeoglobus sp.]